MVNAWAENKFIHYVLAMVLDKPFLLRHINGLQPDPSYVKLILRSCYSVDLLTTQKFTKALLLSR